MSRFISLVIVAAYVTYVFGDEGLALFMAAQHLVLLFREER